MSSLAQATSSVINISWTPTFVGVTISNAFARGDLFNNWWEKIEFDTFIGSISEYNVNENTDGRLSMWRAYGAPSAKAAIVLNMPFEPLNPIKGLKLVLSPVRYFGYEELEEEVTEVINNIEKNIEFLCAQDVQLITDNIFAMLAIAAVSLKHAGFKEERNGGLFICPS